LEENSPKGKKQTPKYLSKSVLLCNEQQSSHGRRRCCLEQDRNMMSNNIDNQAPLETVQAEAQQRRRGGRRVQAIVPEMPADRYYPHGGHGCAGPVFLAGQRPGDAKRHRTCRLSEKGRLRVDPQSLASTEVPTKLDGQLNTYEREAIEAALRAAHGRVSGPNGAAKQLGLPHSTLEFRIKKLGIDKFQFRRKNST
jgi:transcriptional regulator with GAF, ATPase, and Fis domain